MKDNEAMPTAPGSSHEPLAPSPTPGLPAASSPVPPLSSFAAPGGSFTFAFPLNPAMPNHPFGSPSSSVPAPTGPAPTSPALSTALPSFTGASTGTFSFGSSKPVSSSPRASSSPSAPQVSSTPGNGGSGGSVGPANPMASSSNVASFPSALVPFSFGRNEGFSNTTTAFTFGSNSISEENPVIPLFSASTPSSPNPRPFGIKAGVNAEATPLTKTEQENLSKMINEQLGPEQLEGVIEILQTRMPHVFNTVDGEVEIDVDTMDTATMREVERYVIKECNPALYKALYLTGRSASEFIGDTPSVRRKKAKNLASSESTGHALDFPKIPKILLPATTWLEREHDAVLPPELMDRIVIMATHLSTEQKFFIATCLRSRYLQVKAVLMAVLMLPIKYRMSMDWASIRGLVDLLEFWRVWVAPAVGGVDKLCERWYSSEGVDTALKRDDLRVISWWLSSGLDLKVSIMVAFDFISRHLSSSGGPSHQARGPKHESLDERTFHGVFANAGEMALELWNRVSKNARPTAKEFHKMWYSFGRGEFLEELNLDQDAMQDLIFTEQAMISSTARGLIVHLRIVKRVYTATGRTMPVPPQILQLACVQACYYGNHEIFRWWVDEGGALPSITGEHFASPEGYLSEYRTILGSAVLGDPPPSISGDHVHKFLDLLEEKSIPIRWMSDEAMNAAPQWFKNRGIFGYPSSDWIPYFASRESNFAALDWWKRHGNDYDPCSPRLFLEAIPLSGLEKGDKKTKQLAEALNSDVQKDWIKAALQLCEPFIKAGRRFELFQQFYEAMPWDPALSPPTGTAHIFALSPMDWCSLSGNIPVLDWWRRSGFPAVYTTKALDFALLLGKLDVLDWWLSSGLDVRYSAMLLDFVGIATREDGRRVDAVTILDKIRKSALELKYTERSMDILSAEGNIVGLQWWRTSELDCKYSERALDGASANGHLDVVDWWLSSGLQLCCSSKLLDFIGAASSEAAHGVDVVVILDRIRNSEFGMDLKYTERSMDILSAEGNIAGLQWWRTSGLEFKYSEQSIDWASANGRVASLDWWKSSGLPMKFTEHALESAVFGTHREAGVVEWWRANGKGLVPGMPAPSAQAAAAVSKEAPDQESLQRGRLSLNNVLLLGRLPAFEESAIMLLELWEELEWEWIFDLDNPALNWGSLLSTGASENVFSSRHVACKDCYHSFIGDYDSDEKGKPCFRTLINSSGASPAASSMFIRWLASHRLFGLQSHLEIPTNASLEGDVGLLDWWARRNASHSSSENLSATVCVLSGSDSGPPAATVAIAKVAGWSTFPDGGLRLKLAPLDAASYVGNLHILDWWNRMDLERRIGLQYTEDSVDIASLLGNVDVLEWWHTSRLPLKYSRAVTLAARMGHTHVLQWWAASGLPLSADGTSDSKIRKDEIQLCIENGNASMLSCWLELGEPKLKEAEVENLILDVVPRGSVDVLNVLVRRLQQLEKASGVIEAHESLSQKVAQRVIETACRGGQVFILRWWRSQGLPWVLSPDAVRPCDALKRREQIDIDQHSLKKLNNKPFAPFLEVEIKAPWGSYPEQFEEFPTAFVSITACQPDNEDISFEELRWQDVEGVHQARPVKRSELFTAPYLSVLQYLHAQKLISQELGLQMIEETRRWLESETRPSIAMVIASWWERHFGTDGNIQATGSLC